MSSRTTERSYEPLTKCLCTSTWIRYIKAHGWSTEGLFDSTQHDEAYLCDVENWIPSQEAYRFCQTISRRFPDSPDLLYRMAIWGASNQSMGVLRTIALSLYTVDAIYARVPRMIEQVNRHRRIELVERGRERVVLDAYHMTDVRAIPEVCEWTRGILAGVPIVVGLPPADATETRCQVHGAPSCRYEISWREPYSRLRRLLLRLLGLDRTLEEQRVALELSQNRLHDRFKELQAAKEKVEEYAHGLERMVEERTRELKLEQQRTLQTQRILSRYMAPEVVQRIVEGGVSEVWGHSRRRLTLFFSDIKDFTPTTDALEPEDMAQLLNEYFSEMYAFIQKYRGTLSNIAGDGLFVFFGAPEATDDVDHALRCVRMAVDMQLRMRELQKRWFTDGLEMPLQIRCGINTGVATVGGYGCDTRRQYTALGMQTNLAARLEAACPPGEVLISHTTWALVHQEIPCIEHGLIDIKGFHRPMLTYRVELPSLGESNAEPEIRSAT